MQLAALDARLDELTRSVAALRERVARGPRADEATGARVRALAGRLALATIPLGSTPEPPPGELPARVYGGECGLPPAQLAQLRCNCRPAARTATDAARLARVEALYGFHIGESRRNRSAELLETLRKRVAVESAAPRNERLTPATCARMVRDERHHFHAMFGAPRVKSPPWCAPNASLLPSWIADMRAGAMCDRNWHESSPGCESQAVEANFTADGPALLGFDPNIIRTCNELVGCGHSRDAPSAQTCIHANVRILALSGRNPSYNLCRNLEWVVCAAAGRLRGQQRAELVFDPPPAALSTALLWADARTTAYSMKSVYFLETCMLAALCANRATLFALGRLQPFVCRFDATLLSPLVHSLVASGSRSTHAPR